MPAIVMETAQVQPDVISFPVASSGDLTAENTENTEGDERDMNNSDEERN